MPNDSAIAGLSSTLQTKLNDTVTLGSSAVGLTRKTTTSDTAQTVFTSGGKGFVNAQLVTGTIASGQAELVIYNKEISENNKIGHAKAESNQSVCASCGNTFFDDGVIITLKSDGTNEAEALISTLSTASAENFIIETPKDSYISGFSPDDNQDSVGIIEVGLITGVNKRGLLQFDLSDIPFASNIQSATLELTRGGIGATQGPSQDNMFFYKILKTWVETEVTWNDKETGVAWATPGLGSGTDRADTASVTVGVPELVDDEVWPVDITPMVQDWVNDPDSNFGFIFQFESSGVGNSYDFHSTQVVDTTLHPRLIITIA